MRKSVLIIIGILCLSMLSLLTIRTALSSSSQQPILEWQRTYGGQAYDDCLWAIQTTDGGYALTGRTYSFGAGPVDAWLVKTDANGNIIWNQTYGGEAEDYGHCVVQTSDGGYAIAGCTNSFGAGQEDFWLIKTDSDGNMTWNKTYGGGDRDFANHLIQASEGGYVIVGQTRSFGNGEQLWLAKTDADGNMLWSTTYGGAADDPAYKVIQTIDGGYICVGNTWSFAVHGTRDAWLVKFNATGSVEWFQTYGGANWDCGEDVVQTADGGYAMAGETQSFGQGSSDAWLVKTDSNGAAEWSMTYGGVGTEIIESLVQTSDGGYLLAGRTSSSGAGGYDAWLVKTDANGTMEWNKTFGGTEEEFANSAINTDDGGCALAGFTCSFGAGNGDFWLIKLAPARAEFFLHGGASLDNNSPTAMTAKYKDSSSIKFSGGNPWKEIGTWAAPASLTDGRLEALGGLGVWLGLKNSDDQGTNFDLRAEVYKNGVLVASGETYLIKGVTRNPDKASKVTVSFGSFSPVDFDGTNDILSLRILTRIGTDGNGKFGGGHSSAVGLRLYFDAVSRPAMLTVSIA